MVVLDMLCLCVSFWLMFFVQLGSHVSMNVLYVYLYSYDYIIYTFMFVLYVYFVCAVCFNCIPLEIDIYSEGSEPDMEVSDAEPECFLEVDYESGHLFDPESLKNLDLCSRPTDFGDTVYLLGFRKCGGVLMSILHEGRELEQVRMAAAERQQSCKLPSGASIFVYPSQYDAMRRILERCQLRPHNVVISEAFIPLLKIELASIRRRSRRESKVKCTSKQVIALVSHDDTDVLVVSRTFFEGGAHDVDHASKAASF